jgi:hypothetical protein
MSYSLQRARTGTRIQRLEDYAPGVPMGYSLQRPRANHNLHELKYWSECGFNELLTSTPARTQRMPIFEHAGDRTSFQWAIPLQRPNTKGQHTRQGGHLD